MVSNNPAFGNQDLSQNQFISEQFTDLQLPQTIIPESKSAL